MNYQQDQKERHSRITFQKSGQYDWETPQDFFDALNAEFHFTLDPCCTAGNAKCAKFYMPEDDGLSQSWRGERVFMNPALWKPNS